MTKATWRKKDKNLSCHGRETWKQAGMLAGITESTHLQPKQEQEPEGIGVWAAGEVGEAVASSY